MFKLIQVLLLPAFAFGAAVPTKFESRQEPFSRQISSWDTGAVTQYPIHSSCNATQRHMIATGLNETIELASHARDHVLRWGDSSEYYRKFFGNRPSYEVVGAFDTIVGGDKGSVLFRCDNPDGNCRFSGEYHGSLLSKADVPDWGGHWRGSNATDETVICDLSYGTRRPLAQMCMLGYNVAESPTNSFWASDLLHRLYHMPAIGQQWIEHYADTYEEVMELAAGNEAYSTHDSDTLQYFALEVYAFDIAMPGIGCAGPQDSMSSSTTGASASSSTASVTSTAAVGATRIISDGPSTTSSIPPNCHTHEGGVLHCTQ